MVLITKLGKRSKKRLKSHCLSSTDVRHLSVGQTPPDVCAGVNQHSVSTLKVCLFELQNITLLFSFLQFFLRGSNETYCPFPRGESPPPNAPLIVLMHPVCLGLLAQRLLVLLRHVLVGGGLRAGPADCVSVSHLLRSCKVLSSTLCPQPAGLCARGARPLGDGGERAFERR